MSKVVKYLLTLVSIICLIYYSLKFYTDKFISIDSAPRVFWLAMLTIMLTSLLIGLYNIYINSKILKENKEMKELLNQLYDKLNENHEETTENQDDIMETILNSRDVTLDTYNYLKRGE